MPLESSSPRNPRIEEPLKPYRTILDQEIRQAESELRRPLHGLFVSGVLAGLGIGTSLLLMAVVLTGSEGVLPDPVTQILLANALTVGFIVVIMGQTDLFTEYTTIAILPVLVGKSTLGSLARLWGVVYIANIIGAAVFAGAVVVVGEPLGAIDPAAFGVLARDIVDNGSGIIFLSATLSGWLMGLVAWLVTAGRDTISQIFFIWLGTFTIGMGKLHHAVTGSAEVLAGMFAAQGISVAEFGRFLVWTSLGNAVGGVVFALLIRYSLVIRHTDRERTSD